MNIARMGRGGGGGTLLPCRAQLWGCKGMWEERKMWVGVWTPFSRYFVPQRVTVPCRLAMSDLTVARPNKVSRKSPKKLPLAFVFLWSIASRFARGRGGEVVERFESRWGLRRRKQDEYARAYNATQMEISNVIDVPGLTSKSK